MIEPAHDLPVARQAKVFNLKPEFGLLPTAPCVARRLGVDAAHRRTASGTPLRGLAHAARFSRARRRRRRPPTCGDADEAHGDRGDLSASQLLETHDGPQDLPVSAARREGRAAQSGLGHGYYVYPDGARLRLSRRRRRLVHPACALHRVSITMEAGFCIEALEEAIGKYGKPEIFNTDQGSQFTGKAFTGVLSRTASPSVWTARAPGATTFSSSGSGNP